MLIQLFAIDLFEPLHPFIVQRWTVGLNRRFLINTVQGGIISISGDCPHCLPALPHGDEIDPIDGRMPFSRMVLDGSSDAYREP